MKARKLPDKNIKIVLSRHEYIEVLIKSSDKQMSVDEYIKYKLFLNVENTVEPNQEIDSKNNTLIKKVFRFFK